MHPRIAYAWRFLLITVSYGGVFTIIRWLAIHSMSGFNWVPLAALRLSCLLLMPMRYWPAVVIGEAIPMGYANYLCLGEQGLTWVWVNSIPRSLETMLFVWPMRRCFPDIHKSFVARTPYLLACMGAVAVVCTMHGWLAYSLMQYLPQDEKRLSWIDYFAQAFMGNYLAMLSFTPLILWMSHAIKRAIADTKRTREALVRLPRTHRWVGPVALVMVNGLMLMLGHYGGDAGRFTGNLVAFATLLPVAWSYGWAATAMISAAVNVTLVSTMPAFNDFETLYAQGLMVLLGTALLMFAARSSMAFEFAQGEKKAIEQARRSYLMTERMRVNTVCHLSDALDHTRMETTRLMHSARTHMPTKMLAEHFHRLESLHQECECILTGMSPYDWWDFGDREGLIISALHAEGIGCDVLAMPRNARLLQLSTDMCITIHRLGCEAVLHALDRAPSDRISLAFSVKKQKDGYHIEMIVECTGLPTVLDEEAYERLMVRIGAFGLSERGLRERAQLYDGNVQCTQASKYEARVVVRLIDKPRDRVA